MPNEYSEQAENLWCLTEVILEAKQNQHKAIRKENPIDVLAHQARLKDITDKIEILNKVRKLLGMLKDSDKYSAEDMKTFIGAMKARILLAILPYPLR